MSWRTPPSKDPLEFRRHLLRTIRALLGVAESGGRKSRTGARLPAGRFQGIGLINNIGSYTAQVAEVSVDDTASCRVHKRGLRGRLRPRRESRDPAAADRRRHRVSAYGGAQRRDHHRQGPRPAEQLSHQYDMLRIDEMPVIEVHIVPSTEAPGGGGEASTPPVAPGSRQRDLRGNRQAPSQAADPYRGSGIALLALSHSEPRPEGRSLPSRLSFPTLDKF